jgi:hypothetical protein
MTRWQDLKENVKIITRVACQFDNNGIDILFLNQKGITGVTDPSEIESLFYDDPSRTTPSVEKVTFLLKNYGKDIKKKEDNGGKGFLFLFVTAGEPSDDPYKTELKRVLNNRYRPDLSNFGIFACTHEDYVMEMLNKWDKEIMNLDVMDDFQKEKKKFKMFKGKNFHLANLIMSQR